MLDECLLQIFDSLAELDRYVTIGRSVGRQADTIPTQTSTPDQMAAGTSTSVSIDQRYSKYIKIAKIGYH